MSDEHLGMDFEQWVNDNNPDGNANYQKAFWDWIETIRRLASLLGPRKGNNAAFSAYRSSGSRLRPDPDRVELKVVGTITYDTPPPQESISMPVVFFETANVRAYIAYWFSVEPILPSYIVAIDKRSIPEDHEYDLDDILFFETRQNEATETHNTNDYHTLELFKKMEGKVVCDQNAKRNLPFCVNPETLFYGDPTEKTVFTFDELHEALSEGNSAFLAQKPILYSVWSYEGLYSSLSTLHRISRRIR